MQKQVSIEHYDFLKYVSEERMASYYRQIEEVLLAKHDSVLLIGTGDGIVANILGSMNIHVDIFDLDADLKPDIVGNIVNIDEILRERDTKNYDCIVCCQVLEHLEKVYFETIVSKLSKLCEDTCIISLPVDYGYFWLKLRAPKICIRRCFRFPLNFWRDYKFNGEHYWELGFKGHSIGQVEGVMKKYFYLERMYFVDKNPYHCFFILRKM